MRVRVLSVICEHCGEWPPTWWAMWPTKWDGTATTELIRQARCPRDGGQLRWATEPIENNPSGPIDIATAT